MHWEYPWWAKVLLAPVLLVQDIKYKLKPKKKKENSSKEEKPKDELGGA